MKILQYMVGAWEKQSSSCLIVWVRVVPKGTALYNREYFFDNPAPFVQRLNNSIYWINLYPWG